MTIMSAAQARQRAREFREQTMREADPRRRDELQQIADHYAQLAEELERLEKLR